MLLSVCANSQDFEGTSQEFGIWEQMWFMVYSWTEKFLICIVCLGAFQAMLLVKEAGLKPDCKLYTTLISTCGKSGKVDAMFEVW